MQAQISALRTELQEARAQQTATAEVLQIINSSPGDLAPVFDAILEKAHSLCGTIHGALFLRDGENFRAVSTHGVPEPLAGHLRQGSSVSENFVARALLDGAPFFHIRDLAEIDHPRARDGVALAGIGTMLCVALRKDEMLLGWIANARQGVRPFSVKESALLENFAAQAVIAMENARLITETREALEQQTATAEVLGVINTSPGDLAPVFDAMLEKALRLCEAEFGNLRTFDGERFHQAAMRGMPEAVWELWREPQKPPPTGVMARLVQGEPFVRFADAADDESYRRGNPSSVALVDVAKARSYLAVPLLKDTALLGVFTIYRTEVRPFTDKQIALLQNFAAQAVIAMENARLLGELRQRTDEVAELNRGLEARVAEQVEELGRVGRLKRFLAPQLAELIVSRGDEKILESHRREIVVVFCNLRGYTAPSPRLPNRRKSSTSCANTTARWDRLSPSSRGRSTSSRATGSWCSSTTPCPFPTRPSAPSTWRWRCARRLPH
jgi:two-component system NtrC family sensor kinase